MPKHKRGKIFSKIILGFLPLIFVVSLLFLLPRPARALFAEGVDTSGDFELIGDYNGKTYGEYANGQIYVWDPKTEKMVRSSKTQMRIDQIKSWAKQGARWAAESAWSNLYQKTLSQALKTIAYDTATWLGSGGKGQKPMFITEGWSEYLSKVSDNAAGTFLENLGKNWDVNLCRPDTLVRAKITFGLLRQFKPSPPACTFSKMKENWEKELRNPNFLTNFQDMFSAGGNDLGIALSLQSRALEKVMKEENAALSEIIAKKGWLDIRNIAGLSETPPGEAEQKRRDIDYTFAQNFAHYTGNALVDASNIFLNQLAITLINEKLRKLGGQPTIGPYDWSRLINPTAGPTSGGIAGAKEQLRKIIQPNFTVRGDYNVLSELTQCPNPNKAGPTNCVIDDKFSQAIQKKLTVGEALKDGYLKANGVFGFTASIGLEPNYLEGYPYRSMIILRKFRILPLGWEVAGQYIKENPTLAGGTRNLGDLVACFDQNDDYTGYYADWCRGLVDPNWVLKAPLNYCRREGPGPEIISQNVSGAGKDSELVITRNDKYCADEQSCIKENSDGSCQLYGYCTEERRKWSFNSPACEPKYNTCQTFRKADPAAGGAGGQTVSYLENTLNYSGCSADNAGCAAYCTDYNFAAANYGCTVSSGNKVYLDRDAEACDAKNEGCHEFIRTKAGLGANLLINPSFEEDLTSGGWDAYGTAVTTSYDGARALQLNGAFNRNITVGPAGYPVGGDVFSLSFYARDCAATDNFSIQGQATATDFNDGNNWRYYQTTHIFDASASGNQVGLNFQISSPACLIDAIKLERGYKATAYGNYGQTAVIDEKLAPAYLGCDGTNDPAECQNYARQCSVNEVGCELFTSTVDKMSIPAKVVAQDYCVAECVGFDTYLQTETFFDSIKPAYFIPKTAKSCSAATVGCDQFTNLDEVARGGEGIEYYTYLRQCVKPGASCGEFYTWEGSNDTGFQLRVFSFRAAGAGLAAEPSLTQSDATECNETIYNLPPSDPAYNPDCREFYNRDGGKSWHLYDRTVSCSDDCHPYRRTDLNVDPSIATAGACSGADKNWDAANNQCIVCKNGGTWSNEHNSCIYNAIPSQGRVCSAPQAGCREYTGNTGRNIRVVLNNDFESGTRQGWTGVGATAVNLSNESIVIGGRSLEAVNAGAPPAASVSVNNLVQTNKSYVLSFIAKSDSPISLTASLANASSSDSFGSISNLTGDWQYFEINLARVTHLVEASERLIIAGSAGGNFYLDNVKLTEIIDRYYLIKDSGQTPETCNQDLAGNPLPLAMLGCDEYKDRYNETHYLKSFTYLCSESAVGCELMIDTENSTAPARTIYNDANANGACDAGEPDCVTVPADNYIYAVYDQKKLCNQADKGCQRLGVPYNYGATALYQDAYLKNNPDKYGASLCTLDALGCQEYSGQDGLSYFKDPRDTACEWRQGYQSAWGWYKKKIKRCDTNNDGVGEGNICLVDSGCSASQTCKLENTDVACDLDINFGDYKTVGYGGPGNRVAQPGNGWAGLCPAAASGCSELIDPISRFSNNMAFNADFTQDIDLNGVPDGWTAAANGEQTVKLENYTLYRLAGEDSSGANSLTLNCASPLRRLNENNILVAAPATITLNFGSNAASVLFYSNTNSSCRLTVANASAPAKAEIRKAAIDYQLKENLDSQSCNGMVNFNDGCVLFNERSQNGSAKVSLIYDADRSSQTPFPITPPDVTADANVLLKATPDRVCDKWLSCKSKVASKNERGQEENYCFDIGLCDSVDENGNCNNFIIAPRANQTYPSAVDSGAISDYSGYAKAGYNVSGPTEPNNYYPLAVMRQVGETTNLSNGNFELAGSNGYPIGWIYEPPAAATKQSWDSSIFKVINNPISAQKEGVKYPLEGRNLLKLGSTFNATSEFIDVAPGDYILSAYLNTKNASAGAAKIKVMLYNEDGGFLADAAIAPAVELGAGNDWTFKLGRFSVNVARRAKIQLYSDPGTVGNYYFDDVAIRPALESKNITPGPASVNWYTPSSCRLYPKDDSLSCDYYDESGVRQKGWSGYCLEHDRYPGSSDACLLWWPVDKIKGDGVEEGGGYSGRAPLYYCPEGTAEKKYVYKHAFYVSPGRIDGCGSDKAAWLPCWNEGYTGVELWRSRQSGWDDVGCLCVPNGQNAYALDGNPDNFAASNLATSKNDGWYPYNPNYPNPLAMNVLINITTNPNYYLDLCPVIASPPETTSCTLTSAPYRTSLRCDKVVQTVTSIGQNKFWSGRVYQGSDYVTPILSLGYGADYNPFGSAVPPNPVGNPYEWDSKIDNQNNRDTLGIQPLYEEAPDLSLSKPYQVRAGTVLRCNNPAGQPDNCDYVIDTSVANKVPYKYYSKSTTTAGDEIIKRLFAQSYGNWNWNASSTRYETASGGWFSPDTLCLGGTRPAYDPATKTCGGGDCFACPGPTCDYCAVLPRINNIKANKIDASDITISKNGLINLTFNTRVDSQQLPLVSYEVDWGDGETTLVSGVEMRDRPNPDNPHSLYHLYSYWDLRAKSGTTPSIVCGAGQCSVKPRVKIKDNWGWCNGDAFRGQCASYETFGRLIVVTEN